MKQTAVEWLASNLGEHIVWEEKLIDLVEQAKQMEKEQIIDAWNDGYREFYDGSSAPEEYYNQTFKSEKQSYQDKMIDRITKAKSRLK